MHDSSAGDDSLRQTLAREVVLDVMRRRDAGEVVTDAQVMAGHADLMPHLADELAKAARIAAARAAAQIESGQSHDQSMDSSASSVNESPACVLKIEGYDITRVIRRGGQAVVYEGVRQSTGRVVAIKVLTEGPFDSARDKARFEREVRILASLDHPHLVSIIDSGVTSGNSPYYVMPFVPGRALDDHLDWLKSHRRDTEADHAHLLRLFMSICDAVNVAHLRGIIHRDLKPSNILVDNEGQPNILDFGLARTAAPAKTDETNPQIVTLTGQFLGSLPWASPEQAEGVGRRIDTRTDVYALGVILYQMLTDGQFPYEVKGSMAQVLHNIVTVAPTPPSQLLAAAEARRVQKRRRWLRTHPTAINPIIEAIVLKALSKRREERYQTAGEFSTEIANYLSGKPTIALPARPRRPRLPLAVGAVVVLALLAAAVSLWLMREPAVAPLAVVSDGATPVASVLPAAAPHNAAPVTAASWSNSVGMPFVRIEPGEFLMGSPVGDPSKDVDQVQHQVRLTRPFLMGTTEVTQTQWEDVMGTNPGRLKGANNPVETITWSDAVAFCQKLSEMEGRNYRLPTEAEWEYACRAGTNSSFAFGNAISTDQVNYNGSFNDISGAPGLNRGTHLPVGSFAPNAWGLYDMHGNVFEWCADWHGTYPASGAIDPSGPETGTRRIIRGGCFAHPPRSARSAFRAGSNPGETLTVIGLRVVLDAASMESTITPNTE